MRPDNSMHNNPDDENQSAEENRTDRRFVDAPPIDMAHLTRHTLGDEGIAHEVLSLFLLEVESARKLLPECNEKELLEIAHRIKGGARAVGAFVLADIAADIEDAPQDRSLVDEFLDMAEKVELYVDAISTDRRRATG
jgi:HPt (histidine-containing phosphotransfer) domain-containing protein